MIFTPQAPSPAAGSSQAMAHALRAFFTTAPPARSTIGANVLESNSLVLVDAIVPLP